MAGGEIGAWIRKDDELLKRQRAQILVLVFFSSFLKKNRLVKASAESTSAQFEMCCPLDVA